MGKNTGITFGGAILLIIVGIVLLTQAGVDATGIMLWSGLACLFLGIGGIAILVIKELTK